MVLSNGANSWVSILQVEEMKKEINSRTWDKKPLMEISGWKKRIGKHIKWWKNNDSIIRNFKNRYGRKKNEGKKIRMKTQKQLRKWNLLGQT